jgi:hypothetical protein
VLEAGSRMIQAGEGAAAPAGDEVGFLLDAATSLLK